jgi:hypothetical protein
LDNLDVAGGGGGGVDISRVWEGIRENVKASATESLGYYGMKQHKPWLDDEWSKL